MPPEKSLPGTKAPPGTKASRYYTPHMPLPNPSNTKASRHRSHPLPLPKPSSSEALTGGKRSQTEWYISSRLVAAASLIRFMAVWKETPPWRIVRACVGSRIKASRRPDNENSEVLHKARGQYRLVGERPVSLHERCHEKAPSGRAPHMPSLLWGDGRRGMRTLLT